ncbi:MAG: DUF1501 domain-containing protein [Bryobacteraceae bacterium]|nr:DUF1501 domain-containing protein [Bryobacteraceae bacterium]
MPPRMEELQQRTRRYFLRSCPLALGSFALAEFLGRAAHAAETERSTINPLAPRAPHFKAKAKRIIYLHMAGGPSQLEMFDYKPALQKHDGQACPQEFLEGKRFAFIKGVPQMLGGRYQFQQRGDAGTWVSELLPHTAEVADELAVIRSVCTDQFNHAPAQLLMHTGNQRLGYASIGAWATYGLGSENQNLPGFIVLVSGGKTPDAGKSVWGAGFLPAVYQGVQCRSQGEPVLYLNNPPGIDAEMRRTTLDAIRDLNMLQNERFGDPDTLARVGQYELAFRMQTAAPEVMDISKEPAATQEAYGVELGKLSFANNCLLARRLVESGVRYVQLFDWGWDHHGVSDRTDLRYDLPRKVASIDRPIAALIKDLRQRGLLDETLIVWGGEFGRTPMRENRGGSYGPYIGRDHHPYGFTMWMAGGGVKRGLTYGATDEIGYYAVENKVQPHDLQATILTLLGLDPFKFSYPFQGLDQRLIGPTSEPKVVKALIG